MPSNRLPSILVLATVLAAPKLSLAQQAGAAAPQRRPAVAPGQQQQPRQAAGPPRVAQQQPAPQGTQPVRRAPATGQPRGQYPVRQAAGSEPLPQQAAQPRPTGAPQAPATAPTGPVAPNEPFKLTAEQQALLDQILQKWELHSNKVTHFSCTFGRWEVNETFGPKENGYQLSEAFGEIKFHAPDHGVYLINKQTEWDPAKKAYVARSEGLDHWVCNGKSIFEFNHKQRQLIERELAPEMRGKAITDGPLPFVFGTNAKQLKERYWMRDVTESQEVGQRIRLEAWPKYQRDAANFHHAIIMLNHKDFMPAALRIVLPDGKNTQDYAFDNTSVNNPLAVVMAAFNAPRTPWGWTKVVIPAGGDAPPAEQPPAQAQQPRTQTQR